MVEHEKLWKAAIIGCVMSHDPKKICIIRKKNTIACFAFLVIFFVEHKRF